MDTQSPAAEDSSLEPGQVEPTLGSGARIGNRFVIGEQIREGVLGASYRSTDEKSGKTISILVLDPVLVSDRGTTERVRAAVKSATGLVHKNVLGVFGMGKEGRRRYVAREFVDGQTLAELLAKKAAAGKQFTLKGAYNLIAHICNGLQYARERMTHGTLRPSVVFINRTGRVKLADFGFADLRGAFLARRDQLDAWDRPCFPDEDGVAADDLHVLGVMLYALLTGRPPETLDVRAEATARLEAPMAELIGRCLIDAPDRLADPNELKRALMAAIDSHQGLQMSSPGQEAPIGRTAPLPVSELEEDVPPVSGRPPSKAPAGFVIPELNTAGSQEDDGTVQRWLMEKDGIDYGPFTSKQVVEKLFKEELHAESVLFDIETDRRLPLSEFEVFDEALRAWIHEKDQREKRRAEEAEEAAARRRTRLLLGTILTIVVLVGGGAGGWFLYQSTLPSPTKARLAALVMPMRGALPAVSLPEELPETAAEIRERREKETRDRRHAAAAAERAQIAREERLAASSTLDATGGGSGKFNRAAFDRAVAGRNGKLVKCLQNEVRRDPKLKSVTVEITVIPSGQLIGVKMPGGSARGQTCVRRAFAGLRVPAFAGTNVKVKLPFAFQ